MYNKNITELNDHEYTFSKIATEAHLTEALKNYEKILNKYYNNKGKSLDFNSFLNTRVKIDTGKFCNARCQFCYYIESVQNRDFLSLDEIKNQNIIPKLLEKGINEFEFSGGEPTLNWELNDIINYIKEESKNYNIEPRFSIVSNGWKLKEVIENHPDIKEVLISLHGNSINHNNTTKISRSYTKIIDFIKWKLDDHRNRNFRIRINIVVDGDNLTRDFTNLIFALVLNGIQINFLPLNYWSDASIKDNNPNLSDAQKTKKIYSSLNYYFKHYGTSEKNPLTNIIKRFLNPYNLKNNINYEYILSNETENPNYKPTHFDLLKEFKLLDPETNKPNTEPLFIKVLEGYKFSFNYYKSNGSNIINIRYPEVCRLIPEAKQYTIAHLGHFFDKHDWNKIFYPNDDKLGNKNQFIFSRNLNKENVVETLVQEKLLTNFVDKICSRCPDFRLGKCDGLKYIDQKNKHIYKTKEDFEEYIKFKEFRKTYIDKG